MRSAGLLDGRFLCILLALAGADLRPGADRAEAHEDQVQVKKEATGELLKSDKFLALVNGNKSQAQINQEIQEFWWRIGNQTVLRALSQMQGAFNLKTRLLETRQEAWRQLPGGRALC